MKRGLAHLLKEHSLDATGSSSPFQAATSLFSPDVGTKMASDLLIRLSEATQKAQMHCGRQADGEPQRLEVRCGQQDEPGLALSPDGPGASPEPPSLSHTPEVNATSDILASNMLRKLAELQEVKIKEEEEEEPIEVDASDLIRDQRITKEMTPPLHSLTIKTEGEGLCGDMMTKQLHNGAKMAENCLNCIKIEDTFYTGGCQPGSVANQFKDRIKADSQGVSVPKMANQFLSGTKMDDPHLDKRKLADWLATAPDRFLSGVKTEESFPSGVNMADQLLFGAKMEATLFAGANRAEGILSGAETEERLFFGGKMEDQYLRAVLWQDMSVNLASTLLHQLSERISKSKTRQVEVTTPPTTSSPVLKVDTCSLPPPPPPTSQDPPFETKSVLGRDQTSYFYRCHVCGFEIDACTLFQSHMIDEHRQWERGSFSLHCCACNHSTNQEAEMRAHAVMHVQGNISGEMRCPVTPPTSSFSSAESVAMATQLENSTSEHRCRICQRSFPEQQELLVHFQGHRQGNQYRCDRCGHLTRTANKLVEHVRVHTGERPFMCDLCPYSAKRRDSLRLHCKVKHPGDVHTHRSYGHMHRSYVHGDNQRSNKHMQRLHMPLSAHTAAPASLTPLHPSLSDWAGWRDLSPLLPITTFISLKARPSASSSPSSSPSSSSSSPSSFRPSSSSSKHTFLGYLGLTTSF